MRKVALYTDFSPGTGGGAANIRSWLDNFRQVEVRWFYRAKKECDFPRAKRIAEISNNTTAAQDMIGFVKLWLGLSEAELEEIAQPILAEHADVHWVVAHGNGVALGNTLHRLRPQTPLHVSVQDDPERGVLRRSRRYRWLAWMVRRPMRKLLASASSVDVTSEGMRRYYKNLWGVESEVVHPCVTVVTKSASRSQRSGELRIGHIGSIYSHRQFAGFLRGVRCYCRRTGCQADLLLVGNQIWTRERFAQELPAGSVVSLCGELCEREAVAQLSRCDFVYAAYPFESSCKVFRQTSFPTKLSTYVQAQRPFFAHTPTDSTLADAVMRFQTGLVCPYRNPENIAAQIERLLDRHIPTAALEDFRESTFGIHNVHRLERSLLGA